MPRRKPPPQRLPLTDSLNFPVALQRVELQPGTAHEVGARDRIGVGIKPLVAHSLNGNVRTADRAMLADCVVNPLRQLAAGSRAIWSARDADVVDCRCPGDHLVSCFGSLL